LNKETVTFPFDGKDIYQVGMSRRGLMLILSSPSGAGKTTIAKRLLGTDKHITSSISVTTRAPRPGEQEGVDYYFRSVPDFEDMISKGALLEYAHVFGNYYGTPCAEIEAKLNQGKDVLFDIDWQGTQQLSQKARQDVVSIFVLPPSMEELEKRLRLRGQDSEAVITQRMTKNYDEMCHWEEYDYIVVNHNLEDAVARVEAILLAERHRRARLFGVGDFVQQMKKS